jgi:ABC-type multidrug transport system fused ATPase/permease subunit
MRRSAKPARSRAPRPRRGWNDASPPKLTHIVSFRDLDPFFAASIQYFTLYSQGVRTYRRLMGYLRPYRAQLWGSLVFAWAAMGMTVLIPWLLGEAVNAIKDGNKPDLLPLSLAIVGAGILRLGLTVVRRLVAGKVSLAVEFDLRQQFYAHLQRLDLGFFDSQQTGQLMSRATVDLQGIRFFLGYGLVFITQNLLTITLAAVVMVALNPLLALVALIPAPFVIVTATKYSLVSRPAQQEVQQRVAELTAEAEENVSGIRIVKAFAREEHQFRRFQRVVGRVFDQSVYSTRLQAFFSPLIGLLPQIGIALVLLVGGREVIDGNLSLGAFVAFYTYVAMLAGPMRSLGMALGMAQRAVASGNRMFEILDREPAIQSPPGAPALPAGGGAVELRGVTLRYGGPRADSTTRQRRRAEMSKQDGLIVPSADGDGHIVPSAEAAPALRGVDLSVAAGKTIALVGPSGSGKTSLVGLVARLYDPSEGSVSVDGVDVRNVDVGSLRSQIAFVADDSFLFTATIAENIAYARQDASMEEIEAAARRAQADGFIRELPDGYETRVGERGLTLSGGQRQRVAIARALLADPRILILDDATSSVDATTEAAIKAGLREAMAGRTTFIIAHRLSTVSLADQIVVMDGGRIVDCGTHEELMEGCGFYREIAEHGLADSVFLQRDLEQREEVARL